MLKEITNIKKPDFVQTPVIMTKGEMMSSVKSDEDYLVDIFNESVNVPKTIPMSCFNVSLSNTGNRQIFSNQPMVDQTKNQNLAAAVSLSQAGKEAVKQKAVVNDIQEEEHSVIKSEIQEAPQHAAFFPKKKNCNKFDNEYNSLAMRLYQKQLTVGDNENDHSPENREQGKMFAEILLSPRDIKRLAQRQVVPDKKYQEEQIQRLYTEKLYFEENAQNIKQLALEEEMRECTFSPRINVSVGSIERRTHEEFLAGQMQFLRNGEEKKKKIKEQMQLEERESATHRPELAPRSKEIIESKENWGIPIYERLYALSNKKSKKPAANLDLSDSNCSNFFSKKGFNSDRKMTPTKPLCKFTPAIQERSKKIVREVPIDKILYKDALRRQEKEKKNDQISKGLRRSKSQKEVSSSMSVSDRNNKLTAARFLREFDAAILELYPEILEMADPKLDYIGLGEVMKKLGFMSYNESVNLNKTTEERSLLFNLWYILQGEKRGGVLKRNLSTFLLAVLGISNYEQSLPSGGITALRLKKDEDKSTPVKDLTKNYDTSSTQPTAFATKRSGKNSNNSSKKSNLSSEQQGSSLLEKINIMKNEQIKSKNAGFFDERGVWTISNKEDGKNVIHSEFDLFYRNRLFHERLGKLRKDQGQPLYQPQILEVSKKLAVEFRERILSETAELIEKEELKIPIPKNGELTHADLLIMHKEVGKACLEKKAKQKEDEELKECSFKPKTLEFDAISGRESNETKLVEREDEEIQREKSARSGKIRGLELYKLAKPLSLRKDKNQTDLEYEKNCDQCTFQPDLSNTKGQRAYNIGPKEIYAKNIDKTVERLRNSTKEREYLHLWKGRNFPGQRAFSVYNSTLGESTIFSSRTARSKMDTKSESKNFTAREPFQESRLTEEKLLELETAKINRDQYEEEAKKLKSDSDVAPLLFIDVNLGPNLSERITVMDGDKSSEIAERFCQKHGLDDSTKEKLIELLDTQINGLLARIEEDPNSVNSDQE